MAQKKKTHRESTPEVRREYASPALIELGHLADVVQKSGAPPDMQQSFKPGGGGG